MAALRTMKFKNYSLIIVDDSNPPDRSRDALTVQNKKTRCLEKDNV
jgi:hypothetical protein